MPLPLQYIKREDIKEILQEKLNVFLVLCSGFYMYGNWCHTIRYLTDIEQIAESVSTAFQVFLSMIKMVYLLFMQRKLYTLLNQAQTHEIIIKTELLHQDFPIKRKIKKRIHEVMENSWKNIRAQLVFFISACGSIVCIYYFPPLLQNLYHSTKQTPDYKYVLPYRAEFPFWEEKGMSFPYYHILVMTCTCANYIAGMGTICFEGAFIVLCVHGVSLIQVLNIMTENLTSAEVPQEKRVEYLRSCISLYQRIYDYVWTLNSIYKHISLAQFLLSLIVWGIVLFQMSANLESDVVTVIRMVLFLCAGGYQIVTYCFNSQRLTTEYEKIPGAFYTCDWYNETHEFKQLIYMMILRTNRSFNLQVSWFASMTYATFLSMVQTSGSYFLLLRYLAEE